MVDIFSKQRKITPCWVSWKQKIKARGYPLGGLSILTTTLCMAQFDGFIIYMEKTAEAVTAKTAMLLQF